MIFEIDEATNQGHTQGEAFSSVAIFVSKDFEDFNFCDDVLN